MWSVSMRIRFCVWMAMPAFLWPSAVTAETLSDAEKKTIVYRMYADYKKDFPEVEDITPAAAMAQSKTGAVVFVDTRKPEEMVVSTIPGAISQEAFMEHPDRYQDKTIIAYCTISYRSGIFAQKMRLENLRVRNLTGGILAWTLEGGQVVDQAGETRRLHVYGEKWNYAPEGYETVMFGFLDRWL